MLKSPTSPHSLSFYSTNGSDGASYRRWLLFAFLLIAVWALALTISQHFSIPAEENCRTKDIFGRFFLSFFLLAPFVLLLPRLVVSSMLVVSLLYQWGTLYYCSYFGSAPEVMMLLGNKAEGIAVLDTIWAMLPWHYILFLVPVFVFQVVLLYRCVPPKSLYLPRLKWALCCIVCYVALLGILNTGNGGRGLWLNGEGGRNMYWNGDRCAKFGFLPVFARDLVFHHFYLDTLRIQALENETRQFFGLQRNIVSSPPVTLSSCKSNHWIMHCSTIV